MLPTQDLVGGVSIDSAFGWRIDPWNGHSALHPGPDFPADTGTPIPAAAQGVVVTWEHPSAHGHVPDVDHGNNLVTRHAHVLKTPVKKGDLVKRGQKIAEVGTMGQSTGLHFHFEVLGDGIYQDPQKFFAGR